MKTTLIIFFYYLLIHNAYGNDIPRNKKKHYKFKNPKAEYIIKKEDCNVNIDHTENFGPTRDQDGVGFCWAYAG